MPTYSNTSRLGLRIPQTNQKVNDFTAIIDALGNDVDTKTTGWLTGTLAGRPSAGTAGRFYYATDTGLLYHDNGSSWQTVHISTFGSASAFFNSASPASSCSGTISHGLPGVPNMVKFTPTNDPATGTYSGGSPLTFIWGPSTATTFNWSAIIAGVSNNTLNFAWEATL